MSNKMTGLVKWFNVDNGLVLSRLTTAAKMYSYISLLFRATASNRLMKARKCPSPLKMALKARQRVMFLRCKSRLLSMTLTIAMKMRV
ncbi:hypothetical protein ABR26_19580 [Enterobacter bugandensis]|nr:hypothetical protein ABR26_19580 [Enterobacter bugandensis]